MFLCIVVSIYETLIYKQKPYLFIVMPPLYEWFDKWCWWWWKLKEGYLYHSCTLCWLSLSFKFELSGFRALVIGICTRHPWHELLTFAIENTGGLKVRLQELFLFSSMGVSIKDTNTSKRRNCGNWNLYQYPLLEMLRADIEATSGFNVL